LNTLGGIVQPQRPLLAVSNATARVNVTIVILARAGLTTRLTRLQPRAPDATESPQF